MSGCRRLLRRHVALGRSFSSARLPSLPSRLVDPSPLFPSLAPLFPFPLASLVLAVLCSCPRRPFPLCPAALVLSSPAPPPHPRDCKMSTTSSETASLVNVTLNKRRYHILNTLGQGAFGQYVALAFPCMHAPPLAASRGRRLRLLQQSVLAALCPFLCRACPFLLSGSPGPRTYRP